MGFCVAGTPRDSDIWWGLKLSDLHQVGMDAFGLGKCQYIYRSRFLGQEVGKLLEETEIAEVWQKVYESNGALMHITHNPDKAGAIGRYFTPRSGHLIFVEAGFARDSGEPCFFIHDPMNTLEIVAMDKFNEYFDAYDSHMYCYQEYEELHAEHP